uniref:Uncharacterized protein n=1 Tax=Arundo donax TaxID=35708 RepID=A0A0A8YX13_ARUDO
MSSRGMTKGPPAKVKKSKHIVGHMEFKL